ncbi:MAG TPA: M48 family metalloprotease [Candidatus Thermoplasmatota archaeon]|nr:M48 family metalloprotease [Candidatus Thermoplasmatota archaeon]
MAHVSFDEQIRRNERISVLVIGFMFLLLFGLIYAIGIVLGTPPTFTLIFAVALTLGYIGFTWAASTETVLHAAGARRVNLGAREEKLLMFKVEEIAIASGLPVPQVYVQDSRDINAFVTGLSPEKSVMVVTRGALEQLNDEELEGVIGHEMSHILNRDARLATITVGVVGAMAMLGEIGIRAAFYGRGGGNRKMHPAFLLLALLGLILAPLLSRMCYLFLSRRREYLADASGARLTRNPGGLAAALRKIQGDVPDDPKGSKTVAALYISNPWKRARRESVWSTHPPLAERIERLEQM